MPPKGGKKDPKKAAELAALKQQFEDQKIEVNNEEDRVRQELFITESTLRREIKTLRRTETHKYLVRLDQDNASIQAKMNETVKNYSIQVVKLEDELSRLSLSKEVVMQENMMIKRELNQIKADDGGKKAIAQLTARLKQVEMERNLRVKESEEMMTELNRKLSKWMTENRLLQIRHKETETAWTRRVRDLEQSVVNALERLLVEVSPVVVASDNTTATETAAVAAVKSGGGSKAAAATTTATTTTSATTAASWNLAMGKLAEFETDMEKSKRHFRAALLQARDHALGLTDELVEVRGMHSNLSARLRGHLDALSKEQLVVILEAVSFEDSVLDYLESRWPMPRLPAQEQKKLALGEGGIEK